MSAILSAPSKTFLIGEYLVLEPYQALVVSTQPRFSLSAKKSRAASLSGVHPSSPAGLFFNQSCSFKNWSVQFVDPHNGFGGFGASSAQFLLLYCLREMIETGEWTENDSSIGEWPQFTSNESFLKQLLATYKKFAGVGSGADVLSQLVGHVAHADMASVTARPLNWSFAHYDFALVRTGQKLATHNHLKNLKDIALNGLREAFDGARLALENKNIGAFSTAITNYQNELERLELVAPTSQELIAALKSSDCVEAVKGCGAMGADVLFVLFKKSHFSALKDRLDLLNLNVVATSQDICSGLKTKVVIESHKGDRLQL